MPSRITSRPQPFLNRPWDLPELSRDSEGSGRVGVMHPYGDLPEPSGYALPMPFKRLAHWWRRARPPAAGEWRGNEFGWALREIAGEGRHPPPDSPSTSSRRRSAELRDEGRNP